MLKTLTFLLAVCLLALSACGSDSPEPSNHDASKDASEEPRKEPSQPGQAPALSESTREQIRLDAQWQRDHERDIFEVGARLKDPETFASHRDDEEAAVNAILDTVVLLEWQLMGPFRSHPTYGPKGGDLSSDFLFPRTNPANQYLRGRQLVTRGNQEERLAGAELVIRAADTGFSPAQAFAAQLFSRDDSPLDKDRDRAFAYAQAAADQDNFAGHFVLTELYGKAETPVDEKPLAIKHARHLADHDVPTGHLILGLYHENGLLGLEQDYAKARDHFQKAAAANEPLAFYRLAALYANGQGGKQDFARARAYAKIAVARGINGASPWVTKLNGQLSEAQLTENDAIIAAMEKELGKIDTDALYQKWKKQSESLWQSYAKAEQASKIMPSERK